MIGSDMDFATFHDVPPVAEGIFRRKELSFLRRIALFGLCELLRLICNGVESDLAIWIAESLLKHCADAEL